MWRSLCLRDATYDLEGMVLKPNKVEEGTLRLGATKSSDPTSNEKLVYLHEAIMSWTGWSLQHLLRDVQSNEMGQWRLLKRLFLLG